MGKSIEERIKQSTLKNQQLFNDYSTYLKEQGESKSLDQYRSLIIRLLEHSNHQDLQEISFEVTEEFLVTSFPKLSTRSSRASYLKKFFNFLEQRVPLKFNPSDLDLYTVTPRELKNEEKRKAIPLSFEEIVELRSLLNKLERYEQWLTFELIYQFGLRYKELPEFNHSNYNYGGNKFTIEKFNHISMPTVIKSLIQKGALPKKEYRFSAFDYRIKEIGKLIGKDIIWKDIKKTREQNFFRCPKCKELYENSPDNWVIYEYEVDKSKWIVCKNNCALGVMNNE